jgi:membrane-bound serine protease (ClpP class)
VTGARAFAAALAMLAAGALPAGAAAQETEQIPSIELGGDLNPAQADWIGHALDAAADSGAPFAVIRLDALRGLDSATREIVDSIRSAPIPVVVFVYPGGAVVESPGAAIVDAADVAAMAPGTTLEFEGNDLGENTALKQGRIDMIASDQDRLLEKLDGWEVSGRKATTLSTAGAEIDDQAMPLRFEVLQVLVNPNVAFLLLLVGLLALALEILSPGAIVPGAVGAACLVLGLFGVILLPVTAGGVVLLLAGTALIVAEAKLPTSGVLGVLGVVALICGGLLIFDTGSAGADVSPALVVCAGAALGLTTAFAGPRMLEASRAGRARV